MPREELQKSRDERAGLVVSRNGVDRSDRESSEHSSSTVLELLGDEHTRDVLRTVSEQPRNAIEVAESASVSKPTAYRHLNRLEEAGLVTSQLVLDPNGNHHKRYSAAIEEATFRLDGDELHLDVELTPVDEIRDDGGEARSVSVS